MNDPVSIGDALNRFFDEWGGGVEVGGRLTAGWAEIAGGDWAVRSRPAGYRDGTLTVIATDGSAASYLQMRVDALIQRLEDDLGPGVVDGVVIRVGTTG